MASKRKQSSPLRYKQSAESPGGQDPPPGEGRPPWPYKTYEGEKRDYHKDYERNKRLRTFQPSWLKGREDWLEHDATTNRMFCRVCRQNTFGHAGPGSVFGGAGCATFSLTSVHKHAESKAHLLEMCAIKASLQQQIGTTEELSAPTPEEREVLDQVQRVMFTVHALVKHHCPLSDSTWICALDRAKGLEVGEEHSTRRAARVFAHHIAEVERLAVRRPFMASDFASVYVDRSPGNPDHPDVLYLQTCKAGVTSRNFLTLHTTHDQDSDEETSVTSLAEVASEALGISEEEYTMKMVGVCSPGPVVMEENSVCKEAKEGQNILRVSALAHSLEQATFNVFKTSATYRDLQELLSDLHTFYETSESHTEALREACQSGGVPELLPPHVMGARWVSRTLQALNTMWTVYPALIDHLDQVLHEPESTSTSLHDEARALTQKLQWCNLVEFGHFMVDVLGLLDKLLTFLRDPAHCLAEAVDMLESTVTLLHLYPEQPGVSLLKVRGLEELNCIRLTSREGGPSETKADSVSERSDTLTEEIKRICRELALRLAHRAAESPSEVVAATAITNLNTWPTTFDEAKDLGNTEVQVLGDYFRMSLERVGVVVGNLPQDWMVLKTLLYRKHGVTVPTLSWARVHREFNTLTPAPLHLICLILSLPTPHPCTEPAINALRQIHTLGRITTHRLNDRLRIALLCKPMSAFDPKPAALHWWHAGKRGVSDDVVSDSNDSCTEDEEDFMVMDELEHDS